MAASGRHGAPPRQNRARLTRSQAYPEVSHVGPEGSSAPVPSGTRSKQNFAAVADQQPVIVDLFSEGEKVVMFGRETGVIKTTGRAYDLEFVQRFTFRDGRLAAVQIIAAYARQTGR